MKTLKIILTSLLFILLILIYKKFIINNLNKVSVVVSPTPKLETLYQKYTNKTVGYEITVPKDLSIVEKTDSKFVTIGNKITIYLLDSDPEKCNEECPIIDSSEDVVINNLSARYIKAQWKYDGTNTPQKFVNYVLKVKFGYLVMQLQEADFNLPIDINHKIIDLDSQELNQFNKIINTIKTFGQF